MNPLSAYKHFFEPPSITDKLNLFQKLFDSSELNTDLALALLKVIHRELGSERANDQSAYKQYAETIETLRYHKSDMLKQVVDAWIAGNKPKDAEWLLNGTIR